ncbi:MAG: thioredoxin family protein [Aquificota bacterium]|nr:thioredoxin family protein [Aquificota bacterium]
MIEGFQEVTDRDFYEKVMSAETPAVVVFTSPDNPHNPKIEEIFRKHIQEHGGRINFFYMDVTRNTSFEDFGLFNFPAILYFRDTMELERHDFLPSEDMVDQAIRRLLRIG